jgi:hypothetical protein
MKALDKNEEKLWYLEQAMTHLSKAAEDADKADYQELHNLIYQVERYAADKWRTLHNRAKK